MYKTILVPVDLEHADRLEKALTTAADLAKHYNADLYVVGVSSAAPGRVAHNPSEYAEKLAAFAGAETAKHGVPVKAKSMISHDPAVDLGDTLKRAASDVDADLVVMASHVPGFLDHIFSSRAGYLATHTSLSVFIVR